MWWMAPFQAVCSCLPVATFQTSSWSLVASNNPLGLLIHFKKGLHPYLDPRHTRDPPGPPHVHERINGFGPQFKSVPSSYVSKAYLGSSGPCPVDLFL